MIDYHHIMALPPLVTRQTYGWRDTILYALSVGAGIAAADDDDSVARAALRYVYEKELVALPTLAAVIATPGFWLKDPLYNAEWSRIVHGEQKLTLHRQVPTSGTLRSEQTIDEIYDKGPDKGALLQARRQIYDEDSNVLIATAVESHFMRGDGGCGGNTQSASKPRPNPERLPDETIVRATRPEQAMFYRLTGDLNPLHIDPDGAMEAGFPRPIMHGMCTYGLCCHVIVAAAESRGLAALSGFDARFSSPVFPGETLAIAIWWAEEHALFQGRIIERDVIVLSAGVARFGGYAA